MMKHYQSSPHRASSRADNISLNSIFSSSCSSSYLSLNETSSVKTTIKVYANNMRSDVEYKTISVTFQTTGKEIIELLMKKLKIKNRDPRLYYISMDVVIRRSGVCTSIPLEDWECPAMLQSSYPRGEQARFTIRKKQGSLVKIYDSDINKNSQYKTLMISNETTTSELIELYLNTCGYKDQSNDYSLYEVNRKSNTIYRNNKIPHFDKPVQFQENVNIFEFQIKKNPIYTRHMFAKSWIPKLPLIPQMINDNDYMDFGIYSSFNHNCKLTALIPRSSFIIESPNYSEYCN